MSKGNFILKLYQAKNTVFTAKEIALLLSETNKNALKSKISYYAKKGTLRRVWRGIYVKPDYDKLELATKVYTPSYVGLETVLAKEGVIFQHYETTFIISYLSRKLAIDGQEIQIRKIKNEVLLNPKGIFKKENYSIAIKERAFLDTLYLYKNYHFDNLEALDKNEVFELMRIYGNKEVEKTVKRLFG